MERSSPLAAMQPSATLWGLGPESFNSNPYFARSSHAAPASFNFRDLSMKSKSSSNYFTLGPVRGSSPTASLAADLSQNFHIDKSPQLPTPRRSLFTSNLFGTLDGREQVTTPPLPSSSPGPGNDSMDLSPLPHKAPYAVKVDPPTPGENMDDSSMLSSPTRLVESPLEAPRHHTFQERRKPPFLRPSLARAKGFSTNTVSLRSNGAENKLPAFTFGTSSSKPSVPTSLSLGECFGDSPPQDRKQAPILMGPPRARQPFGIVNGSARNGSPINSSIRKPLPSQARPRKQFRRTLSMFEKPGDVMKQEKKEFGQDAGLQSIADIDDTHQLGLPHFIPEDQADSLPRISKETLVQVLDGQHAQKYTRTVIIDCRFEYEYEGGHIEGAVNHNNKESLAQELFTSALPAQTLLVFHCEYSAHRAPMMAKYVRHRDRSINDFRYPQLSYPEMYILDGGYSAFFPSHPGRCFPQSYVEMDAQEHASTCEREMGKLRQRTKLGRAATFAFGQHDQMESSPTGPARMSDDSMMGSSISSQSSEFRPMSTRRLASYPQ